MARPELPEPSTRELRTFGLLLFLFLGVLGGLVFWRGGPAAVSLALWLFGTVFAIIYYAVPVLRRPLFFGWMTAVMPLGKFISYLLFALIYYLVVTPIGLLLRVLGRSPLTRGFEPEAETYWVERRREPGPGRYFRQF